LFGEAPSSVGRAAELLFNRMLQSLGKLLGDRGSYAIQLLLHDPRLFLRKTTRFLVRRLLASRADLFFGKVAPIAVPSPENSGDVPASADAVRANQCAANANRAAPLVSLFGQVFPRRLDRLRIEDVVAYDHATPYFRGMFRFYDIVQCYSTEPIFAL